MTINYAPSIGGAQLHVQRIAEGLAERGHDIEVLTTDGLLPPAGRSPGHIAVADEVLGGVRVRRFRSADRVQRLMRTGPRVLRKLGVPSRRRGLPSGDQVGPLSPAMFAAAVRSARSADVIVGVSLPFLTVAGSQWATLGSPATHVSMPLLHLPDHEPSRRQTRMLRRSGRCMANTAFERSWLLEHGVRPERITVIPPGCDPDDFPELDAEEARSALSLRPGPTIGYIGRLAPHKGIDTFLGALPELWSRHPDLNVLIAGARTGWDGLEPLMADTAAVGGDRLQLLESFDAELKRTVYGALDVVVFPSREESFGMITIEAWCARRAVVAPDIGAVRCVVHPGEDGVLMAPGDVDSLIEAVSTLVEHPATAARLADAGRLLAESEYAWPLLVDRWDAMLGSILADRRPASAGTT